MSNKTIEEYLNNWFKGFSGILPKDEIFEKECKKYDFIDLEKLSLEELNMLDREIKTLANVIGNYVNPIIKRHKKLCDISSSLDPHRMFLEVKGSVGEEWWRY